MAGTVALTSQRAEGIVRQAVITLTGDASDGTFPATTLQSLGIFPDGTFLTAETNPGATAPDSNYDITLVDADGLDRFNGACLNRSSGTSERVHLGAFVSQNETLTLTVANNATVDAEVVLTLTWVAAAIGTGKLNSDGTLPVSDADLLTAIQTLEGAVHAEDDAHTSTDSGVFILGVRNTAGSNLTDADGDYSLIATDARGAVAISAITAHDAVDAGNPIKIGGKASTSTPTVVAHGDRVDAWFGGYGQLAIGGHSASGSDGSATGVVAIPVMSSGSFVPLFVAGSFWNGASWDRARPNVATSYLASAARTATPTSADITTYNARGIRVSIDVTAIAASPSVVPTIEVKDAVAGTYTAILTGAAIVGTGHTELVVMPGITPAANVAAAMALARTMRVSMTHGDADSITYSVAVELLV